MKLKTIAYKLLMLLAFNMFIFNSCAPGESKTTAKIPREVIPPDSMVLILTDMQITESILREYQRTGREDEKRNQKYYRQVFEKYNLSNERLQLSVAFYEKNPDIYYQIYTDIVSLMTRIQSEEKAAADTEK
jgi:hypothetical protein